MKEHSKTLPTALVSIDRLIDLIFDKKSAPSVRFIYQQKAQGKLPFYKLGKRVFFNPQEVMKAISEQERRAG